MKVLVGMQVTGRQGKPQPDGDEEEIGAPPHLGRAQTLLSLSRLDDAHQGRAFARDEAITGKSTWGEAVAGGDSRASEASMRST